MIRPAIRWGLRLLSETANAMSVTATGRSTVKFCMVTTFFGPHSFGGDAAYVERLSDALVRQGHEVHVFYCVDAFESVRGRHPLRHYQPPQGIHLHPLKSPFGILSPLATQATGLPLFKADALREHLDDPATDVVHFHNISLVGGPGVLQMGRHAIRLMTAHEHWLICPMHLLWKYNRQPCDQPDCNRCMLAGRRPPQLWRRGSAIARGLRELDLLLFPSKHAMNEHRSRGLDVPMRHLPYFLPDAWDSPSDTPPTRTDRPYLAAAGRLVRMKGFQNLIPIMHYLPEIDLRIAGAGPLEPELRRLAKDLPNVRFEGLLPGPRLADLFRDARAVVVPSLFAETFGYVVLEAFAVRTPVVVHEGGGAIRETGFESGGGLRYRTDDELLVALRRICHDDALREELAQRGHHVRMTQWSEEHHLKTYLGLIRDIGRNRPHVHTELAGPHAATPTFTRTRRAEATSAHDRPGS